MLSKNLTKINYSTFLQWLGAIALTYLLIAAVSTIGTGFQSAVGSRAEALFAFAANPLAGLLVGALVTASIQSSSTVTAILVGLVAGGLPVGLAVPIVMGANIGTTITNTLVSLGHARNSEEFQRAFAAATVHDFFNLTCVAIFLPLEVATHFLEKAATSLAQLLLGSMPLNLGKFNPIEAVTAPFVRLCQAATSKLPPPFNHFGLIVLGIALIFCAILYLGKLLKLLLVGESQQLLRSAIGRGPLAGILSGTAITVLVQSSSTTTSFVVPLAGIGLLELSEIYPFVLGANVGTCITALLAATAVSQNQVAALTIAAVHFLFNFIGILVVFGLPFLRNIPLIAAQTLAAAASRRKFIALLYIIGVFFLLPGILLWLTSSVSFQPIAFLY
jgi:sodium-dependent phosphate cotransporter